MFTSISGWARAFALLVAVSMVPAVSAATFTLQDNGQNSSLNYDTSSGEFNDWFVEGVDQLFRRQYFYRVGTAALGNPELAINESNLNLVGTNHYDTNFIPGNEGLAVKYSHPMNLFDITFNTLLTAGAPGSAQATFTESVRIDNTSGQELILSLFLYADFDLDNDAINDGLTIEADKRSLTQTEGLAVYEAAFTVTPSWVQASEFPALINSLTDGDSTTLDNTLTQGANDNEYGIQWNIRLKPRQSFTLGNSNSITVPEVSTLAMVGIGCLSGLVLVRRRSR